MKLNPYRQRTVENYPRYIDKALKGRAKLYCTGLNLIEMMHTIEANEFDRYLASSSSSMYLKEFRHNLIAERAKVEKTTEAVWRQITAIAQLVDVTINKNTVDAVLTRLKTQQLDGYDYLQAEAAEQANINAILTDDIDYLTVAGLTVLTANQNAADLASTNGKLANP